MKGMASMAFIITGMPKMSGSLILNNAGTMPIFAMARKLAERARNSKKGSARVAPDPRAR